MRLNLPYLGAQLRRYLAWTVNFPRKCVKAEPAIIGGTTWLLFGSGRDFFPENALLRLDPPYLGAQLH